MGEIYLESGGARLFTVEWGSGAPIILLHGGLATHHTCLRFGGRLGERFRLVAPDLRASGRSHWAGELSWELLADDIAALARRLGIARAAIGGASFGAGVAMKVALRHPELVSALVVLSPAYGGADVGLTAVQEAAMDAMDAAGRRAPAEGITMMFPLLDRLPAELREPARALFATYDPASVAASTRFMASGVQPFASASALAAITAPTLLVPGSDPEHPAELCERFARYLPRPTIRAAGADAWGATIGEFLDQVALGSAS